MTSTKLWAIMPGRITECKCDGTFQIQLALKQDWTISSRAPDGFSSIVEARDAGEETAHELGAVVKWQEGYGQ